MIGQRELSPVILHFVMEGWGLTHSESKSAWPRLDGPVGTRSLSATEFSVEVGVERNLAIIHRDDSQQML